LLTLVRDRAYETLHNRDLSACEINIMNPEQDLSYENDGGEPPRRSRRPNFGQMPDRYGNPVYVDRRTAQPATSRPGVSGVFEESLLRRRHPDISLSEVRDVPADDVSVRSSSTRRSTRSMQKRLEAELKMAEELQARKREIQEREKARMELDRKIDEEQFVAEQRVAELRHALEQARIDEEDRLSQDLSDQEDDQSQASRRSVTFTVEAPGEYAMIQPPVPFGNSPQHPPANPIEKVEEDFSYHDQVIDEEPEVHIGGSRCNPSGNRQVKIEDILQTMATTMDAIARVTTEKKDASTKSTSSKFLARQSASKDLPHFYGDSDDWPNFIAEFERSTALCEFSNVENISRLQRCLKGKAKESVKSLLNVPDNVPEIISILTMCFGRPDQIIKSLIEKAVKAPPVKEGRLEFLVEFSNAVRNVVSTVEHLHCTEYLMNPQLIEELVHKLPTHLQLKWGSKLVKLGKPDLGKFSEWLKKQGMAASLVSYARVSNSERDTDKKGRPSRVLNTVDKQKQNYADSTGRNICSCCQKMSHDLSKCFQFTKMNHDDRWKFARTSRFCFQCLRAGHRTPECKGRTCGVSGCRKSHHFLLHKKEEKQDPGEEAKEKTVMMCRSNAMKKTLLQILPVVVVGPKGEAATYCLLDPGAEDSFIEWDIASRVGLTGPKKPIQLVGPGISKPVYEKNSREVNCGLRPVSENQVLKFNTVSTVKHLNLPKQTVDVSKLCEDWPYLQDIPMKSYYNVKPTILIGQDNCHLLTYDEKAGGKRGGPIAIKTALGWTIHGRTTAGGASAEDRYVCHVRKEDDVLHQIVKQSFQTEDFGVKLNTERRRSAEDSRAQDLMKKFSRQVTADDGLNCQLDSWMVVDENPALKKYATARWSTCLPWKEDSVELPESYSMAARRLKSIEHKMDKSEVFACEYMDKIEAYINKGFARKLSPEEASVVGPKTWYLPHFDVVNPNKPGKFRMVFDAAAKSNGVSLNDALIQGPDLLNPLATILMQFRQKKIGFTADIRDMFHRVWIRPEDSCAQRFLWRGMDRRASPSIYEMRVMVFGTVSSPYCAHYVKNMNAERFREEFPDAVNGIIKKHYVDDYLDCADSEEEALRIIDDVRMIHRKGGFDILEWTSSSRDVLKKIPIELQATGQKDLEPESALPIARVLGLYWDPNEDWFTFTCKFVKVNDDIVTGGKVPTKREMLKLVMSVFDPLGFLSHFTVKAKILLQEVWRTSIDWDDEVTEEIFSKWCQWLKELKRIPELKIRRCYSLNLPKAQNLQLHLFCDASLLSFAAVGYIRVEYEDEVDVSFVMARTRVAPLKSITLPRLELQGAVMAVRLAKTIQDGLAVKFDSIHFWTDNSCVLGWIRADSRRFVTFVANRVGEIQEDSDVDSWYWVPTTKNVADDATRDKEECDFSPDSRWVNGPEFLKLKPEEWPKEKFNIIENADAELKKVNVVWKTVSGESLPDVTRFSSWLKLIRSTSWLVRFIMKIDKRTPTNTDDWESWRAPVIQCLGGTVLRRSPRRNVRICNQKCEELCPDEYMYAEKLWIRQSQWDSFPEEMVALSSNKQLDKSSKLLNLAPYLENGIMKIRGRLDKSKSVSAEARRPVVLDPRHPYTVLLINHYHLEAKHVGQETVVNELRQKYWIFNARAAVKSSWNACNLCKINRAKPVIPEMGDLPEFRLNMVQRPFIYTGLDYFGPMEVTIGRRHEKRYGALFTCLSTRAIHLELASSLDTDSFIMAITRFAARRGVPSRIYSDNGTNFHGADNELKKCIAAIDSKSIRQKFCHQGLDWIFNPPSAPHMGGVWERLVQSVKVALKNMLKTKFPKEEVLHTALLECERIVNSRPITHVPADPDDPDGLTPNHFLLGSSNGQPPPGDFSRDLCPKQRWMHCQVLADHFWKRWVREYLPTLSRRSKWTKAGKPINVGDLVFIADGDLPRCQWPRGRIVKVFPGSDGNVRVADVKTITGVYRRPVVKLCVLDVNPDLVDASRNFIRKSEI